jgi:hypothetical protein
MWPRFFCIDCSRWTISLERRIDSTPQSSRTGPVSVVVPVRCAYSRATVPILAAFYRCNCHRMSLLCTVVRHAALECAGRDYGFEGREDHRTLFASGFIKSLRGSVSKRAKRISRRGTSPFLTAQQGCDVGRCYGLTTRVTVDVWCKLPDVAVIVRL